MEKIKDFLLEPVDGDKKICPDCGQKLYFLQTKESNAFFDRTIYTCKNCGQLVFFYRNKDKRISNEKFLKLLEESIKNVDAGSG
jgi:hypothetical protein